MDIAATEVELSVIERLHEEGLEEARSIQSLMLPTDALHAGSIEICHEFQPMAAVGGDFLDYFELPDGTSACMWETCRKGAAGRIVCSPGGWNVARHTQDGAVARGCDVDVESKTDDARCVEAARGDAVCGLQSADT